MIPLTRLTISFLWSLVLVVVQLVALAVRAIGYVGTSIKAVLAWASALILYVGAFLAPASMKESRDLAGAGMRGYVKLPRRARLGMLFGGIALAIAAQSFSNIVYSDLTPTSVRFTGNVSVNGWVQGNIGVVSGGPYTLGATPFSCSGSPSIDFSGGGGSGAFAYFSSMFSGIPTTGGATVVYGGTGYATPPSVTISDPCPPSYPIIAASWSSGTATVTTNFQYDSSGQYAIGSYITVTGMTPSAYNVSHVLVTNNDGANHISYALASNPGSATGCPGGPAGCGTLGGDPGSGATATSTITGAGGSVNAITVTCTGSCGGYHTQLYANASEDPNSGAAHDFALVFTGLSPNTPYYVVFNFFSVMNGAVVTTSSEIPFTTQAGCNGPCLPAQPAVLYDPAAPGVHPTFPTTGCSDYPYSGTPCYHVIPFAWNGTTCAATSTVGPVPYGSVTLPGPQSTWTVNSGDDVETALNEIGFGAILEFAQGAGCYIPVTFNFCSGGFGGTVRGFYELCALAVDPAASGIDDPIHRWVVLRTKTILPTDFPPNGFRADPSWTDWGSHYASLIGTFSPGVSGLPQTLGAESGATNNQAAHHYWAENIKLLAKATTETNTVTGMSWSNVGGGQMVVTGSFANLFVGEFVSIIGATPSGFVLNKYQIGVCTVSCNSSFTIGGGGTYGTSQTIPDPGASYASGGSVVLGIFGAMVLIGNAEGQPFDKQYPPSYFVFNGVIIQPDTRVGDSIMSTTGIKTTIGGHFSVSDSYLGIFDNNQQTPQSIYYGDCGAGPLNHRNNTFIGIGENVYAESNGPLNCNSTIPTSISTQVNERSYDDVVFSFNDFWVPYYTMQGMPQWDTLDRADMRNQLESKQGHRWKVCGNTFNGQVAQQSIGEFVAMTPTVSNSMIPGTTGSTDWTVCTNLFVNGAVVMSYSGQRTIGNHGGSPQPATTGKLLFKNNYAWNIGKNKFGQPAGIGWGPGFGPCYLISGGSDVSVLYNTFPSCSGDVGSSMGNAWTTWFEWSANNPAQGGFLFRNNILSLDGGPGISPIGGYSGNDPGCCSLYLPVPIADLTNSLTLFDGMFSALTPGGIVPSKSWGGNIITPGNYPNGTPTPWIPMTDAVSATLQPFLPTGDMYVCVHVGCSPNTGSDQTIANHMIAAGVPGRDAGDPSCIPTLQNHGCDAGVNKIALQNGIGYVTGITVERAPTALQFNLAAPDINPIVVDISADGGTTWARCTNGVSGSGCASLGAGTQNQSVIFTGLSSSTSYLYRVMGYRSQTTAHSPWLTTPVPIAPWITTNTVTDGISVSTLVSGTRTAYFQFSTTGGVATATVTVTPIGASALSAVVCSTSPCPVAGIPNGGYSALIVFKTAGGVQLSANTINNPQ